LPPAEEVEGIAAVLFGRAVESVGGRYPNQQVRLEGQASGGKEAVEAPFHPDPGAEAVRAALCEGELVQAIGRARAVRRTPDTPLRVVAVGNTPIPGLQPDHLRRWEELVPDKFDLVAARWGVLPLSPAALVKAGGWNTVSGAKQSGRRELVGTPPLEEYSLKGMYPLSGQESS